MLPVVLRLVALVMPTAALISGLMTTGILAATWKLSPRRE